MRRSGAVPSFGPSPFGGPVSDAYALRFFFAGGVGAVSGLSALLELLVKFRALLVTVAAC
jgi:hypothetical protein